ncbi:hypothetical protein D5R38_18620 [Serratia marcescens]|uniref:phage tail tip fiber protein n=1 Tax=Serratia marcescens TaxID=615 RepID=UPI00106881EB|nr:hypothetical protein [Serratia marcescens]TEW83385.1 hypothetical protein D5R38_18620 [Serratia marcescens]
MAMIAVGAIIAGASAAAAASAAALSTAAIIGIGLAAAAVTGLMGYMGMQQSLPQMQSPDTGQSIGTTTDPKTVLPVIYGRERSGVVEVWKNIAINDDTKLVTVFAICEGEIEGFHNIYFDKKRILKDNISILKSGIVERSLIDEKYRNYIEIELSTGSAQGHHLSLASRYLGQGENGWSVQNVGKNIAMGCIVVQKTNDGLQDGVDIFNSNAQLGIELSGLLIRDLNDNTIKPTDNGPSQILDYVMNSRYGLGVPVDFINVDSFKEGANFAYTNNMKSNGAMDPNASFKQNITNLSGSFGGFIHPLFGQLTLSVDAPGVVQYNFDEDNILQGTVTLKDGESNGYYNTLNCTIRSPESDYADIVYRYPSEVENDEQIKKDKRIITKDVDYRFVKSKEQLDKLASIERNKSILQQSISFNTADAYGVKVWDVIRVSNAELKLKNSLWRVTEVGRSLAGSVAGQIQIKAIEYNDKVYSNVDIAKDPNFNGSDIPDATIVIAPTNLKVKSTGQTAYGQNVVLTWEAEDDFNRYGFRIQYKASGSSEWINAGFTSQKYFEIFGLNVADYDFRVCASGIAARSEWATIEKQNPSTVYELPHVTGLTLLNAMENTTTTKATEFRFAWDDQSAQKVQVNGTEKTFKDLFRYYEVKVTGNSKTVVYKTADTNFTYSWEQNVAHGLSRKVTIGITAIGYGGKKSPEVNMTVQNNQHPVIKGFVAQAGISVNSGMAFCSWTGSVEPDFKAVQIQVARDPNFTKEVSSHESTGNMLNFDVAEGGWYIRASAYDAFGLDDAVWSESTFLDVKYKYEFTPEDIKNIEDMTGLNEKLKDTLENANKHANEAADQAKKDANKYTDNTKTTITGEYKTYTDTKVAAESKRTDTLVAEKEKALNQRIDETNASLGKTNANITEITKTQAEVNKGVAQKITTIETNVGDNTSKITSLSETVTTNDKATGQRFDKVEARVGATEASVTRLDKAIVDETKARAEAISQVRTEFDGKVASVSDESKAEINKVTGQINASRTMTVDANGVYGGFKLLANDGPASGSAAIFSVDKFMVTTADKDPKKVKPIFVADGNEIYMDTALIRDGSIGNAKIANASIDSAKIVNASIDSAKIAQHIQSDNWVAGQRGWAINKDGGADFANITARGTIYANNGEFNGTVNATNGVFRGRIEASEGFFTGEIRGGSGWFDGAVRAAQIQGPVTTSKALPEWRYSNTSSGGSFYEEENYNFIGGQPYEMSITIPATTFTINGGSGSSLVAEIWMNGQLISSTEHFAYPQPIGDQRMPPPSRTLGASLTVPAWAANVNIKIKYHMVIRGSARYDRTPCVLMANMAKDPMFS